MSTPESTRPKKSHPNSKRGRATAFDVATVGQLLSHIRNGGVFRTTAATLVGLWPRTVQTWMEKGHKEIAAAETELQRTGKIPELGKFAHFVLDVLAAEAEVEAEVLGVVLKIARAGANEATKLEAATWYLSRLSNTKYGSGSQRTDVRRPGDIDDEEPADASAFVMDQLRKFKRALDLAAERGADGSDRT